MGTIQPEYLIVKTWSDDKGINAVDNFIKKANRGNKIFYKGKQQTNGYISYWMDWDGSKEGWNASNKYDRLRLEFISICKEKLEMATIIRIIPSGDIEERPLIEEIEIDNL